MNVLFLSNAFHTGGAEQLNLEIMRRLRGGEFRFHVCCLKEEGSLAPEVRKLGVPVDSGFLRGRYDPLGILRLTRALRGKPFDILFTGVGRNLLWVSSYLAKAIPVPRRITAIHATRMWGREKMFHRSQLRILKRLDGVIACAETQSDFLVREEGVDAANLTVIFNGVDHRVFRPVGRDSLAPVAGGPLPGAKRVGIVASLTPEKGHDVFVEAAARTTRDVPDSHFFLIGEGPERERIERRVRRLDLAGRVHLLGRRRDLPDLLPHLDLLGLSSHPFRETLPISTMEGMACALPTVNTDVGSIRDLVVEGKTGFLVPPADPEALAAAFVRLLRDPDRAARMGNSGRKRIEERFTLDRTVEEYRRYFHRITGSAQEAERDA